MKNYTFIALSLLACFVTFLIAGDVLHLLTIYCPINERCLQTTNAVLQAEIKFFTWVPFENTWWLEGYINLLQGNERYYSPDFKRIQLKVDDFSKLSKQDIYKLKNLLMHQYFIEALPLSRSAYNASLIINQIDPELTEKLLKITTRIAHEQGEFYLELAAWEAARANMASMRETLLECQTYVNAKKLCNSYQEDPNMLVNKPLGFMKEKIDTIN